MEEGSHHTGAGDRKEERRFISNFHGKIAAGAKGGELMGVEEEDGRIGKLGSLGGQAFCMPNRWGKTCGARSSNRMQRGTELKTAL